MSDSDEENRRPMLMMAKLDLPAEPPETNYSAVVSLKDKWAEHKHCPPRCRRVEMDSDAELLICKDCGKQWSAFKWIKNVTSHRIWLVQDVAQLQEERAKLAAEVAKLKRQRRYQLKPGGPQ